MRVMPRPLPFSAVALLVLASVAGCGNASAESTSSATPESFLAAAPSAAIDAASAGVAGAAQNVAEQAPAIASAAPIQHLNQARAEATASLDDLDTRADAVRPSLTWWADSQLTTARDAVETALSTGDADAITLAVNNYAALLSSYETEVGGAPATSTATPLPQG